MHHDTVADDPRSPGVEHAGRQEVELEGLVADHDRVPRVRTSGHTRADVVISRQDVDLLVKIVSYRQEYGYRFVSNIVSKKSFCFTLSLRSVSVRIV